MSKTISLKSFCILLIVISMVNIAAAQDTLLTVPYKQKLDSIQSSILNQKRYVQVFLPENYKPDGKEKYDVLYVLDGGNWNMNVVAPLQRFIQNEGHMPPTIIVSITGIDRNIELTPTVLKSWNGPTGGADHFLAYIKNELIPFINKTYPSNGDNTIWGHSLGGMFAFYAMLKEPTLFKSFILVDPSLWWDDTYVPKMAATKLPTLTDSAITLFISGRPSALHDMKIDTIETLLQKYAPANIKWKLVTYAGETHSSLRMKSTYDGLKYTYEGQTWGIEFIPMNGIVLKDKPYKIIYNDDTSRIHYTLDGTAPTEQSALASHVVTVNAPATVTYKLISNRARYSSSVVGEFTTEKLSPPGPKPKAAKPGGFTYTYYEGDSAKRPDLKTAIALKKGIMNKDFVIDSLHRKSNYALLINGFLEAKEDGYYTFFVKAGKGSKLWIDGKQIMHWDDNDKHEFFTYLLPLSKGFYPVRIESFDKKEDFNLVLYYLTPSMPPAGDPMLLPFDLEYSNGKK